jgi:hypothetical protein
VPAWDPAADPVNLAGLRDEELALLRRLSVPHPYRTVTQPLRLNNPGRAAPPAALISCTFPLDEVRRLAAGGHPYFRGLADPAVQLLALPTGHWPMLSRPDDLAAALHALAPEG